MKKDNKYIKNQDFSSFCTNIFGVKNKMKACDLFGKSAQEVLEASGADDDIRIDLVAILKTFNISAISYDFSKIEKILSTDGFDAKVLGAMMHNGDDAAIFYSNDYKHDSHRARFTIAHEIAHCCLHESAEHIEFRTDGELSETEIEANIFAGELLIPENSLLLAIKELIMPTVSNLAEVFDVSINVMSERIKHLNFEDKVFMKL